MAEKAAPKHRQPTNEESRIAWAHMDGHVPVVESGQQVCSSATHLIVAPDWPCQQYIWAQEILDTEAHTDHEPSTSVGQPADR